MSKHLDCNDMLQPAVLFLKHHVAYYTKHGVMRSGAIWQHFLKWRCIPSGTSNICQKGMLTLLQGIGCSVHRLMGM